jgi:Rrf2 family protein
MFSKTCEYAVRALIFIAQNAKNANRVGIKEIAKGIDSPEHFIAKILQDLGKRGLVQSAKGPNGGFYLEDKSLKKNIADIVLAIDGDKIFTGCGLGLDNCSEKKPCPIHHEYKHIREGMTKMLRNAKLADFTNPGKQQDPTFLVS